MSLLTFVRLSFFARPEHPCTVDGSLVVRRLSLFFLFCHGFFETSFATLCLFFQRVFLSVPLSLSLSLHLLCDAPVLFLSFSLAGYQRALIVGVCGMYLLSAITWMVAARFMPEVGPPPIMTGSEVSKNTPRCV